MHRDTKGYYEILGLQPTATPGVIKAVYRARAMELHPDRNKDEEATRQFQVLQAAYECLSDQAKREAYDRSCQDAPFSPPAPRPNAQSGRPSGAATAPTAAPMKRGSASPWAGIWIPAAILLLIVGLNIPWNGPNRATIEASQPAISQATPPAVAASPARPKPTWTQLLPAELLNFDEASGTGRIRYASLPARPELASFSGDLGKPFELKLLQALDMSGGRKLLLFASRPPMYECHACHPIVSAMLIGPAGDQRFRLVLPFQALTTGGRYGELDLTGDQRASLVKPAPDREAFVYMDSDEGQGNTEDWGVVVAIEPDRFRLLGSFHVHSDGDGSAQCEELQQKRMPCPRKDTKIKFDRASASNGYFDIRASEVSVDAEKSGSLPISRQYVLRFNGSEYAEATSEVNVETR